MCASDVPEMCNTLSIEIVAAQCGVAHEILLEHEGLHIYLSDPGIPGPIYGSRSLSLRGHGIRVSSALLDVQIRVNFDWYFLQEAFKKKANNLDWIGLLLLQESCKDLYWIALAEWIILV